MTTFAGEGKKIFYQGGISKTPLTDARKIARKSQLLNIGWSNNDASDRRQKLVVVAKR
jgi:hypothetical protein